MIWFHVYHDSLGQNRFYAPGVGAPRIADNFGNYAKIDNAHNITPPSSLSSKGTWVGVEENNNTQIMTKELVENSKHYFENYQLEFDKQIDSNNYKTKLEFREYLELLNQILFSGEIFLDDKWNRENSFDYLNNKFNNIIIKTNSNK